MKFRTLATLIFSRQRQLLLFLHPGQFSSKTMTVDFKPKGRQRPG